VKKYLCGIFLSNHPILGQAFGMRNEVPQGQLSCAATSQLTAKLVACYQLIAWVTETIPLLMESCLKQLRMTFPSILLLSNSDI